MDELSGQGDLQALFEARRRIVAAFEDIAAGTEALVTLAQVPAPAPTIDPEEVKRLRVELEEERIANAQLEERVRVLNGRLRSGTGDEALAAAQSRVAELEALLAARAAEVDAVLARLVPLLEEAQ